MREEFELSPSDLPSTSMYKAANLTDRPRVGNFLSAVERIRPLMDKAGLVHYTCLCMGFYQYLAQMLILKGDSLFEEDPYRSEVKS